LKTYLKVKTKSLGNAMKFLNMINLYGNSSAIYNNVLFIIGGSYSNGEYANPGLLRYCLEKKRITSFDQL